MSSRYNAADIEVLSGLDPVKRRPGMYTDTSRPNHLAQEVIDNSVDEALAGHAKNIEVVLLADGSVINLAPESRIDVRYGPAERRIRLLDGQGLFDVASNPARPFIVEVAQGEVRAVGTSFDVIAGKDEAAVTVVEGVVRILLAGKDKRVAGGAKEARKGELVRFGTSHSGKSSDAPSAPR